LWTSTGDPWAVDRSQKNIYLSQDIYFNFPVEIFYQTLIY